MFNQQQLPVTSFFEYSHERFKPFFICLREPAQFILSSFCHIRADALARSGIICLSFSVRDFNSTHSSLYSSVTVRFLPGQFCKSLYGIIPLLKRDSHLHVFSVFYFSQLTREVMSFPQYITDCLSPLTQR